MTKFDINKMTSIDELKHQWKQMRQHYREAKDALVGRLAEQRREREIAAMSWMLENTYTMRERVDNITIHNTMNSDIPTHLSRDLDDASNMIAEGFRRLHDAKFQIIRNKTADEIRNMASPTRGCIRAYEKSLEEAYE